MLHSRPGQLAVTCMLLQVDEARKVLVAALMDAWPEQGYMDIFARTAAKICIQQGFVLGKAEPYQQTVVHAPNMGTHLHKLGCGMVRGTLQQMLVRPEIQPYFKLLVYPKNTPPSILCLLANVFHGHPSEVVNDIVEQTYLVEPGVEKPYILPASNDPRPSLLEMSGHNKQTEPESATEASTASNSAAPAESAAVPASPDQSVVKEPPMPAVSQET